MPPRYACGKLEVMAWTMRSRTMRLPFLLATPVAGAHGG